MPNDVKNKMLFPPSFAYSTSQVPQPFQVHVLLSSAMIILFSAILNSEVLFMLLRR